MRQAALFVIPSHLRRAQSLVSGDTLPMQPTGNWSVLHCGRRFSLLPTLEV